ncbi:9759_t:CDS:2, partial [Funneliformis caledonium]
MWISDRAQFLIHTREDDIADLYKENTFTSSSTCPFSIGGKSYAATRSKYEESLRQIEGYKEQNRALERYFEKVQ